MPVSASAGPVGRHRLVLSLTALALLLAPACSASSDAASGDGPTAAPPLPAPEDGDGNGGGNDGSDRPEDASAGGGPLSSRVVVIDPGHNGGNAAAPDEINTQVPAGPGEKSCDTVGSETADGYAEHEFNWELSLLVRDRLEADGATVVLTRDDNEGVGPCIDERARIGNQVDADAAVSIHADGGPESGRGFHVIAPGEVAGFTDDIVEPSLLLAHDLRREYRDGTGMPYADYLADEGLDERTDLGGLNMSDVPKVFLEAGNLRNPEDADLLADPGWREAAADAIARGVAMYLLRS